MRISGGLVKQAIKRNSRILMPFMVLLLILVCLILFGRAGVAKQKPRYLEGPHLTRSDRIMVIAPHPDDESLATAGVIRRAVKNKIPVLVILMTNGDGYKRSAELYFKTLDLGAEQFRELGVVRHSESLNAIKELGLSQKNVIFLSYPDGGTNSLLDENWDYNDLHLGLNGATHAPYSFAYEKEAPYCGENVVKNLEQIIKNFKPSVIFYPDPGDDNHDHWATSAFVEYVLSKMNYKGKQFTYLVHKGFDWPLPWLYAPKLQLLPPSELLTLDAKWLRFFLSKDEEALKRKAVDGYVSQIDLMEPFLDAFVRRNELFSAYPDIKVTQVKKKPNFFSGGTLPNTVFKDPKRDTFIRYLEGFGDLNAVGFAFDNDNAWLALETRRGIARDLAYIFRVRIFGKKGVKRLDIKILGETASSEILAKNSVKIDTAISVKTRNNRLFVQIPAYVFKDANCFLLAVDTLNSHGRRVDRTAYRRIDF